MYRGLYVCIGRASWHQCKKVIRADAWCSLLQNLIEPGVMTKMGILELPPVVDGKSIAIAARPSTSTPERPKASPRCQTQRTLNATPMRPCDLVNHQKDDPALFRTTSVVRVPVRDLLPWPTRHVDGPQIPDQFGRSSLSLMGNSSHTCPSCPLTDGAQILLTEPTCSACRHRAQTNHPWRKIADFARCARWPRRTRDPVHLGSHFFWGRSLDVLSLHTHNFHFRCPWR